MKWKRKSVFMKEQEKVHSWETADQADRTGKEKGKKVVLT